MFYFYDNQSNRKIFEKNNNFDHKIYYFTNLLKFTNFTFDYKNSRI